MGGPRAALIALTSLAALHAAMQMLADVAGAEADNTVELSGHSVSLSSKMSELEIAEALGGLVDSAFPQFALQGEPS